MPDLEVIIPVLNEQDSVRELVGRIDKALRPAGISYGLIFVDDHSTDNTTKNIRALAKRYPIVLLQKQGLRGKAYSILEGVARSKADILAMIDGDLQYPPEALPEMYTLAKTHGVVVANRKKNDIPRFRKIGSDASSSLVGKLLLGMNCDAQSGLKVFKREIIDEIEPGDVKPWALDMPLLYKAREMGEQIGTVKIDFAKRENGRSKVNFAKTAFEIAITALKLKFGGRKVHTISPQDGHSMLGAGVTHKQKKYITHTSLPHANSALMTIVGWQKWALVLVVLGLGVGILVNYLATLIILVGILSAIYFADVLFSGWVLAKSLHFPPELKFSDKEVGLIKDKSLPVYSILCPLYKEGRVLPEFIESIKKLDWPKSKLEILLLLEEDDEETQKAAESIELPHYVKVVVVPDSQPRTKPKACNYGLALAKGEYVVVYDAEDRPDPLQLKKAYLGFEKLGNKVFCLQSKLNYHNPSHNLLTRLFTAEYSLWFDVILPGLQSIEASIPLGGTSNHFRTKDLIRLHAWDPFNVTEDCDLGVRIFKAGEKTAIIDSTTYEEANSSVTNWIRQRSRWIKGYIQTYLVHMREPIAFVRSHGLHAFIFQLTIGMRMTFMLINPFLWVMTIAYFALRNTVGPAIEALYPAPIFYVAAFALVVGNFMYIYNYMIGCAKHGHWELVKYVFVIPVYWVLASIAATKAMKQLVFKPHFWEKTHHGLHLELEEKLLRKSPWVKIAGANLADLFGIFTKPFASGNGNVSPESLRILFFNWRDIKHVWAGGAEVYVHELAKRWVAQGHKVTLFCGNDGKNKRNEDVDGVRVIRRGGFYTVYFWAFVYYVAQFRRKYDVVIESENGVPFFTPLYSTKPKFLVIHHVHQEVFREHLSFVLSTLARFVESKLMPFIYRGKNVLAVSESTKRDIALMGFEGDKINVVSPGVDGVSYRKSKKTKYPSFVYLGRHKAYKNIDVAIRAFLEVVKSYPAAQFAIAGKGDTTVKLRYLVKKFKLHKHVKFLGRVDEKKKISLLGESWAAIQPSSFEGWGITVIEANACGTPVIASKVSGLKDSVVDGKTGVLVAPKNAELLAGAMKKIVEDAKYREQLSVACYEWAQAHDWSTKSQQFLNIIKQEVYRGDYSGDPAIALEEVK